MEIIRPRSTGHSVERRRDYTWTPESGETGGFSFDVDEDGKIIVTEANEDNVALCLVGTLFGVIEDHGITEREWSYHLPAIGRCDCGEEVHLDGFTNTCECGADYNSSGQRLAPRSQWGEETGESLGDILRIP